MLSSPSVAVFALVTAVALTWLPEIGNAQTSKGVLPVWKDPGAEVAPLLSHPVERSRRAVGYATAEPVRTLTQSMPLAPRLRAELRRRPQCARSARTDTLAVFTTASMASRV